MPPPAGSTGSTAAQSGSTYVSEKTRKKVTDVITDCEYNLREQLISAMGIVCNQYESARELALVRLLETQTSRFPDQEKDAISHLIREKFATQIREVVRYPLSGGCFHAYWTVEHDRVVRPVFTVPELPTHESEVRDQSPPSEALETLLSSSQRDGLRSRQRPSYRESPTPPMHTDSDGRNEGGDEHGDQEENFVATATRPQKRRRLPKSKETGDISRHKRPKKSPESRKSRNKHQSRKAKDRRKVDESKPERSPGVLIINKNLSLSHPHCFVFHHRLPTDEENEKKYYILRCPSTHDHRHDFSYHPFNDERGTLHIRNRDCQLPEDPDTLVRKYAREVITFSKGIYGKPSEAWIENHNNKVRSECESNPAEPEDGKLDEKETFNGKMRKRGSAPAGGIGEHTGESHISAASGADVAQLVRAQSQDAAGARDGHL